MSGLSGFQIWAGSVTTQFILEPRALHPNSSTTRCSNKHSNKSSHEVTIAIIIVVVISIIIAPRLQTPKA